MKVSRLLTFVVVAAALVLNSARSVVADESPDAWTDNIEAAMAKAKTEKKDLLINFTGSDWCIWCKRLEGEVFSKKEFLDDAQKHFVLVKLDFPRDKSKLSKETIKQNDTWKKKFGVSGFPTVYFTNSTGRPYAKAGYAKGGPKAYLPILEAKRGNHAKLVDALAKAEKAKGIERAKLLDQALALLEDDLRETHYANVVEEIVKLDSKNEAGLRAKYNAAKDAEQRRELLAKIDFAARTQSPKVALSVIDKALNDYWFPVEDKVELLQVKLKLLDATGGQKQAVALLKQLIADQRIDPDTRDHLRIRMIYSLVKAKQVEDALEMLDVMIVQNKRERHRLLFSKGELLDRLGRHEEAIRVYDGAIKAAVDDDFQHEVQLAKSDSLASLDQIDEAVSLLDKLVANKETPRYLVSDTLIQKAMILRDAKRISDAQLAEQKAIDAAESPTEKVQIQKLVEQLRRQSK